jgi:hypothetical protein
MARPFARRAACSSAALLVDEGVGVSTAGRCVRRSRQVDSADASPKKERGVAPVDRRAPQTRDGVGLRVGATLVRERKGKLERVMIFQEGFAWKEEGRGRRDRPAGYIVWRGAAMKELTAKRGLRCASYTESRPTRGSNRTLPRCSAQGLGGLHQEPSRRGLEAHPQSL